jgi:hypothetical protein
MYNYEEHTFGEWCYRFGPHLLTTTYYRDWRHLRPWRKLYTIRCYECDININELAGGYNSV